MSTLAFDQSYGGVMVGDGIIETNELNINQGGGFTNGENISLRQQGAISGVGIFTNQGEIEPGEWFVTHNFNGFPSQSVTFTQNLTAAQGSWTDLNGDTNIDTGEASVTEGGVLFEDGEIIIISTNLQVEMARINFTDSENDIINNGELVIIDGGSGFSSGIITLLGQDSSSLTTAQFIDTNIACMAPSSVDWVIESDCILFSNQTAPKNVIIQNNSLVTVMDETTLDIDFANFHLIIKSGSGILIKPGGAVS